MRSSGAVAQRLALALRRGASVSGGGVWLGAVDMDSVSSEIELPCLVSGRGATASDCGGGLHDLTSSTSMWCTMGVIITAGFGWIMMRLHANWVLAHAIDASDTLLSEPLLQDDVLLGPDVSQRIVEDDDGS